MVKVVKLAHHSLGAPWHLASESLPKFMTGNASFCLLAGIQDKGSRCQQQTPSCYCAPQGFQAFRRNCTRLGDLGGTMSADRMIQITSDLISLCAELESLSARALLLVEELESDFHETPLTPEVKEMFLRTDAKTIIH
jgi:hypothetical protein